MSLQSCTSTKKKTSPEQLNYLVEFISNNLVMIHGKTKPSEAGNCTIEKLWDEVTAGLNSIGSEPTKTKGQWKKVFIDWKCHTKKKARDFFKEGQKTGGGENDKIKCLTPIEEKLMSVLSWISVEGADVAEVGLETVQEPVMENIMEEEINEEKRPGNTLEPRESKRKVNDKSGNLRKAAEAYAAGQQHNSETIKSLLEVGKSQLYDEFKRKELELKEMELKIRLIEAKNKTRELDLLEKQLHIEEKKLNM